MNAEWGAMPYATPIDLIGLALVQTTKYYQKYNTSEK